MGFGTFLNRLEKTIYSKFNKNYRIKKKNGTFIIYVLTPISKWLKILKLLIFN